MILQKEPCSLRYESFFGFSHVWRRASTHDMLWIITWKKKHSHFIYSSEKAIELIFKDTHFYYCFTFLSFFLCLASQDSSITRFQCVLNNKIKRIFKFNSCKTKNSMSYLNQMKKKFQCPSNTNEFNLTKNNIKLPFETVNST